MTTPALRSLRRAFPKARISLLAKPWVVPLFAEDPHVDHILVYDDKGRHRGFTGKHRLASDLKGHGFDGAVLFQNAFEAALIARLAAIPLRIGYDTDARRLLLTHPVRRTHALKSVHQTEYYLGILRGVGIPARERRLHLYVGQDRRGEARDILRRHGVGTERPLVGINPGATYGPAKQWFPGRFAELADRIHQEWGARVLIFGGPDDRELGRRISGMMTHRPVDLSGATTLSQAMALIGLLDLFITNDSGLMHVAAALNTPLIAVFGPTNPVTTGPLGSRSRVAQSLIQCSPCLEPRCPLGHMNCMHRIRVDTVLGLARDLL